MELPSGIIGAIIGAIIGMCATWLMWIWAARGLTERQLLSEALAIQSLLDAWQVELESDTSFQLTHHMQPPLPLQENRNGPWLRNVEIRAALDDAQWNYPGTEPPFYAFLDGRRAWIVRDRVCDALPPSYSASSGPTLTCKPALLSSRAIEELRGWVERVASAREGNPWFLQMLTDKGRQMLAPLLDALAGADRRKVLALRLTDRADCFLKQYAESRTLKDDR